MLAKEEELVKVKERQLQAEEMLKEFETKQQQVFNIIIIFFFLIIPVQKSQIYLWVCMRSYFLTAFKFGMTNELIRYLAEVFLRLLQRFNYMTLLC